MSFVLRISLGVLLFTSVALWPEVSRGEDELPQTQGSAPQIKTPSFPLEPGKKASEPINPKTYVNAPDAPPPEEPEIVSAIPRKGRSLKQWWIASYLGWVFVSQSAVHQLQTPSQSYQLKRSNANMLSIFGRMEFRPPRFPISWIVGGAASFGSADTTATGNPFAPTQFDAQDYRGAFGLRIHPLSRRSKADLRLGADAGVIATSVATLTPAQNNIDVDLRKIYYLMPKLEFRYGPNSNWFMEFGLGYAFALKTQGSGDVAGKPYRRIEGSWETIRYISPGQALGLGAYYTNEKVTWIQTLPSALTDAVVTQDLRLSLFWRHDL